MSTKQGKYIYTIKDAALPLEDYINSLKYKYQGTAISSIDKETISKEYTELLFLVSNFLRSGPYILSPEY